MNDSRDIRVHVRVHGVVQGVGYRAWTEREAHQDGITGWVRNCEDGSVEAVLNGPRDLVNFFIEKMKHGPRFAQVDEIEVREDASTDVLVDFHVTR